jgi:hypothetical protein
VTLCSFGLLLQANRTPVYFAAMYGRKEVVGLLLDVGAAVNVTSQVRQHPGSISRWTGATSGMQSAAGTQRS